MDKQSELLKKMQDAGYLVELDASGRAVWGTLEYVWAGYDGGSYVWASTGSDEAEIGWACTTDEVLAVLAGRVDEAGAVVEAPPDAEAPAEPKNDFERGLYEAAKAAGVDVVYDMFGYACYPSLGCVTSTPAEQAAGGFRLSAPGGRSWPSGFSMWVPDVAHAALAFQSLRPDPAQEVEPDAEAPTPTPPDAPADADPEADAEAPAPPAAHDPVNHPSHYTSGGIECIDAIVAALGVDGAVMFCRGNAMKYLWRTGAKDPAKATEDLRKAGWYIAKAVALQEGK